MTLVAQWVQKLTAEFNTKFGIRPLEVGKHYIHKNREIVVVGGKYWGTHGLSNFWYWRPILADGMLGPQECGYDMVRLVLIAEA